MKMKTIIKLLFVFSLPFIFCRCADDGIHYEREINVPEGIYLTGSASQFSVEAINGKMNVIKEGTLGIKRNFTSNIYHSQMPLLVFRIYSPIE